MLKTPHPFATRAFLTDGHSILATVGTRAILDVVRNQFAFSQIIRPYLRTDGIDFSGEYATKWWPLGRSKSIVIDSGRSFGQPIVAKAGVPTTVLHRCYRAEASAHSHKSGFNEKIGRTSLDMDAIRIVADWYEVDRTAVRAAIEYETRLAA